MRKINSDLGRHMSTVLSRAIEAKMKGDGRPFVIGHFITNRCPCECASCLWKHNDWKDVATADIKRFYLEAKEQGFVATAFSGGEPFLRKDLGEIVRFVKEKAEMPILLFTTGWYLEERMDEVLPHISMLMLSLDSARPGRHDTIRGLPGLFDRLMRAVSLVKEKYPELSVQFNTCVQKGIAEEIDPLLALARRVDVPISFDVITEFRNAGEGQHFTETNMSLPPDELRAVSERLLKEKRAGSPILNSERYFEYFAKGRPGYTCHLPKITMCVDGRGYVEDCLNLSTPIAHINDRPLKDIMELPRFKQLRTDAEACSSCNSPTMVDLSNVWENPQIALEKGGIEVG